MLGLLDLIFPKRCLGCGKIGVYVCKRCRQTIHLRTQLCPECDRPAIDGLTHPSCLKPYGLDGLMTVFRYDGIVKKAIKDLKYHFVSDVAGELVGLIPDTLYLPQLTLFSDTLLYPIPLHKERLRWRGFNQAEKLGRFVAPKLHIKLVDGILIRQIKRTPQADILHRENRIKNARGLFKANFSLSDLPRKAGVEGIHCKPSTHPVRSGNKVNMHVMLFDDVWTTGATMKEATKILKRGGVEKVWGMTIAR